MKVAFDEELNGDEVETLRKLLLKLRNPVSVMSTFAFSHGHFITQPHQLHMKVKEKNASLKLVDFITLQQVYATILRMQMKYNTTCVTVLPFIHLTAYMLFVIL